MLQYIELDFISFTATDCAEMLSLTQCLVVGWLYT